MADIDSERKPLLGAQQPSNAALDGESTTEADGTHVEAAQTKMLPGSQVPYVSCRVCQSNVNVEGRSHQHVVKCHNCGEATPIRAPPPGKKYVRCPCNCLLICKASSSRIACPRPNCKRVITLGASAHGTAVRAPEGTSRISCAHCLEIFMFNVRTNALARCPHCQKVSSVGSQFARSRAIIFALLGLSCLAIGAGVAAGTWHLAATKAGIYIAWSSAQVRSKTVIFLLALILLARSVYYAVMKVSFVEGEL